MTKKEQYIEERLKFCPDSWGALKNSFEDLLSKTWDAAVASTKATVVVDGEEVLQEKTTKGQDYSSQYTRSKGQHFQDFTAGFDCAMAYMTKKKVIKVK